MFYLIVLGKNGWEEWGGKPFLTFKEAKDFCKEVHAPYAIRCRDVVVFLGSPATTKQKRLRFAFANEGAIIFDRPLDKHGCLLQFQSDDLTHDELLRFRHAVKEWVNSEHTFPMVPTMCSVSDSIQIVYWYYER
jgi:hypothetical protein